MPSEQKNEKYTGKLTILVWLAILFLGFHFRSAIYLVAKSLVYRPWTDAINCSPDQVNCVTFSNHHPLFSTDVPVAFIGNGKAPLRRPEPGKPLPKKHIVFADYADDPGVKISWLDNKTCLVSFVEEHAEQVQLSDEYHIKFKRVEGMTKK